MENVIENMDFSFRPSFEIVESGETKGNKWLKIGGVALEEGVSANQRQYSIQNLQENNGKEFKWVFGHPKEVEEHIIGKGVLEQKEDKLLHVGKIRNTNKHPDVVESVVDGFLEPSIHATAKKVYRKDSKYVIEGLNISGVGLVGFKGVKGASIDYAIAESYDKELNELKESSKNDEKNKDKGDTKMSEEEIKKTEAPEGSEPKKEEESESKPQEEKKEEVKERSNERIDILEKEIENMKLDKKTRIVESIVALNKDLKAEELIKESEDKLQIVLEYETKLSKKTDETAIVESEEEKSEKEQIVESEKGVFRLSEKSWADFNKELKERI